MTQETYWAMRRREIAKQAGVVEPKPKKKSKAKAKPVEAAPEVTYGEGQAGELQGEEGSAVQGEDTYPFKPEE